MALVTDLIPFAVLGLAGSLHCAGMCGPFALSLHWNGGSARAAWSHALLYVVGKALTYSLITVAALAGVSAAARHGDGSLSLSGARSLLAWTAGTTMIVVALRSLGVPLWPSRWKFAPWQRALAYLLRSTRALPRLAASFGLGLVNGLLPCGLSLAAISLGAASPAALAALGPFVFGLCTGPVLIAISLGGSALPTTLRVRAQRVVAVLMLAFGAWTIARGGLPFGWERNALPPCCSES